MPPSASDSEKVAILFYASLYFSASNSVPSRPYLEKAYGVMGRCTRELLQQSDVTPEAGFLFGLLGEIITMKTDGMKGELKEILKGTLCGEGETVLQHLVDFLCGEWEALKFLGLPPHPAEDGSREALRALDSGCPFAFGSGVCSFGSAAFWVH